MGRSPVRIPGSRSAFLDIFSAGRYGPGRQIQFTPSQIAQIARTVRGTPEVMVKVTGGGTTRRGVAAHVSYIGRDGELEIETDEGERIQGSEAQRDLLQDWHLDLTPGQYRRQRNGEPPKRPVRLVYNIVLSMPAPTPEKVLAAARSFAREKFALKHRYALVLHTDQKHPHVHIVVKAEAIDGRRLHIDKPMLRAWREDFAQMMRDQAVGANATPSVYRGRNKSMKKDASYRAQRRRHSTLVRSFVESISQELRATGRISDQNHTKLEQTRRAVIAQWRTVADILDRQGEITLAGDVRYFAAHFPPVLTDREQLGAQFNERIRSTRYVRHSPIPIVDTPSR
jgi:relaxase-like protein